MSIPLTVQRRTTGNLVDRDGTSISLSRGQPLVPSGTGGWERAPGAARTLAPRKRFFAPVAADRHPLQTADGIELQPDHVLIGNYDDDIRKGDAFTVGSAEYVVTFVHDDRSYEVRAECAQTNRNPRGS